MVEYRRVSEQQQDVFFEYTSYAFRPENGPEMYDPDDDWPDLNQYKVYTTLIANARSVSAVTTGSRHAFGANYTPFPASRPSRHLRNADDKD